MKFEECCIEECTEVPCLTVYWPGKTPPPRYCVEHAEQAVGILKHMGIDVHVEPYQPQLIKE